MSGNRVNTKNSHYLNWRKRLKKLKRKSIWEDRDADYNIRSGITFGETEERTIEQQEWDRN